ncbi:MFS transporter [Dermabacteraceae bacterium P7054]
MPFVILLVATVLSTVGDEMASMAMILPASAAGRPDLVTAFTLMIAVPPILLAPIGGALVDRGNPKVIWVSFLLLQAFALLGAALVEGFWARAVILALSNIANLASGVAAFVLLPHIRGRVSLERANSLLTLGSSLAYLLGPATAASLFVISSPSVLLLIDAAATLLLGIVAFGLVRLVALPIIRKEEDRKAFSIFRGMRDGWRAVRESALIFPMLPLLIAVMVGTSMESVAGVFWLQQVSGSTALYGIILSCWAAGSMVASVLAGNWGIGRRVYLLVVGGALVMGIAISVEALIAVPLVIALAFILGGAGNGFHNVGIRNMIYRGVPESRLGSAWSYYRVMTSASVAFGYVLGTPSDPSAARSMVLLSGIAVLGGIAISGVWAWRIRARVKAELSAGEQ